MQEDVRKVCEKRERKREKTANAKLHDRETRRKSEAYRACERERRERTEEGRRGSRLIVPALALAEHIDEVTLLLDRVTQSGRYKLDGR